MRAAKEEQKESYDDDTCDEEGRSESMEDVGIYYIPWKVIMSLYYVERYPQSYVKE